MGKTIRRVDTFSRSRGHHNDKSKFTKLRDIRSHKSNRRNNKGSNERTFEPFNRCKARSWTHNRPYIRSPHSKLTNNNYSLLINDIEYGKDDWGSLADNISAAFDNKKRYIDELRKLNHRYDHDTEELDRLRMYKKQAKRRGRLGPFTGRKRYNKEDIFFYK
jgi:hypothetical protein